MDLGEHYTIKKKMQFVSPLKSRQAVYKYMCSILVFNYEHSPRLTESLQLTRWPEYSQSHFVISLHEWKLALKHTLSFSCPLGQPGWGKSCPKSRHPEECMCPHKDSASGGFWRVKRGNFQCQCKHTIYDTWYSYMISVLMSN